MKIVYLKSARDDLVWMRRYYESVFPDGQQKAQKQFYLVQMTLMENPFIGHETHKKSIREFPISKTPFSFIYRVCHDRLEILRIWDERRSRI